MNMSLPPINQSKVSKDASASAISRGAVIEILSDDRKDETTSPTSTLPSPSSSSHYRRGMHPGQRVVIDELSKWLSEHEDDRECLVYACERLIEEEERARERNVRKNAKDAPPRVTRMEQNRRGTDHSSTVKNGCRHKVDIEYYDVDVPVASTGSLMIDIRKRDDWIVFGGYRRFKDGSQGPAEVANLFRSIGDKIVSINDHSIDGKTLAEVFEYIRATTNKNNVISLRLLHRSLEPVRQDTFFYGAATAYRYYNNNTR